MSVQLTIGIIFNLFASSQLGNISIAWCNSDDKFQELNAATPIPELVLADISLGKNIVPCILIITIANITFLQSPSTCLKPISTPSQHRYGSHNSIPELQLLRVLPTFIFLTVLFYI